MLMADISNDIRLAVDSGKVAIGLNRVSHSILSKSAKMVVIASKNEKDRMGDMMHLAKLSNIRVYVFEGTSMDLGVVCGKPYSISVLAIIDAGNSKILNE
jgi:large subunit ribosomal protein L30e